MYVLIHQKYTHYQFIYVFMKITALKQKVVWRVALFYISANLFKVWIEKREFSHLVLTSICFAITIYGKFHFSLREQEWKK